MIIHKITVKAFRRNSYFINNMSNKLYIIKNDDGLKIITVDYKLHSYEINKYELINDVYINMYDDFEETPMNESKLTDDDFEEPP